MRDDSVYLRHIAESIDLVEQYLAGADGTLYEDLFYDDRRTQDAVLRRMETLADAARHPEIPWKRQCRESPGEPVPLVTSTPRYFALLICGTG